MDGTQVAAILVTLGGLCMLGLVADVIGRHTPFPRVTLLLLAGVAIGPSGIDALPTFTETLFPVLASIALAMIGFLLGGHLSVQRIRDAGAAVFSVTLGVLLVTALLVTTVLALFGVPIELALILGGVALATAPAATLDVVHESRARGPFSELIVEVVALDDAWGLLLFTLMLAAAQYIAGHPEADNVVLHGARELGGSILLGIVLGVPMAYVTGRIRRGEPMQVEAIGMVLLAAGLAEWLGVSYLLTCIVLGAVVASLARHHERPFHAIEEFEWPFLVLFFLLAGASFELTALGHIGWLLAGYVVLRIAGRVIGAYIGASLVRTDRTVRRWAGIALLPQAGVALGMSLIAVQAFPAYRDVLMPVVFAATILFEILGPIATRRALTRVGEARIEASTTRRPAAR